MGARAKVDVFVRDEVGDSCMVFLWGGRAGMSLLVFVAVFDDCVCLCLGETTCDGC